MTKLLRFWPFLIIFAFCLTPVIWFWGKGDVLINGVDTNFPLDPQIWFNRRFYVWNAVANAGSDFSSSTAGLFFHLIQVIPFKLGLNLQQVQITSFIFWFSLIIFGSFLLARVLFPKRSSMQLVFVALYSFNIYLFNAWENVKVANLSLVAAVPLALALFILLKQQLISIKAAAVLSVFIGIILSGTGINPAYFASFFLILFVYLLGEIASNCTKKSASSGIIHTLSIGIPILLVNLFWILPTLFFITFNISPDKSIDKIGFTNWIDGLSENTSILNVLRIQGAWDWYSVNVETNTPYYIPYASNYFYKLPFIIFSLILPLLSFVALFNFKGIKNYPYLSFGIMLIVGVFLGVGTHLPSGNVFRFLLNEVPFFTLFRSPWYIFTPLVTLSIAGLVSLLLLSLDKKMQYATFLLVAVIVIGNLFYSYPLISGRIFRPERPDSFYVQFPDYIFQAKNWLSESNEGRIVSYPDIEVENFNWGYRGIETILELLVDREALFMPLNMPDSPLASLLEEFYMNLKKGELAAAKSLAGKLNISLIFNKADQVAVTYKLDSILGGFPANDFGEWIFYKFPNSEFTPKIFSTSRIFFAYPYNSSQPFFAALKPTDLVLNPEDSVAKKIPGNNKLFGSVVLAENRHVEDFVDFKQSDSHLSNRLLSRDLSQAIFHVEFTKDEIYQPSLEIYRLEDFGIDLSLGMEVEIDGQKTFWAVQERNDSFAYFKPVSFSKGRHQIKFNIENKNLVEGGDFEGENKFLRGGEGKGEGMYEILGGNSKNSISEKGRSLSLTNIEKADIAAVFKLSSFDPLSNYYMETKYRQIYGNHAQILVSQWDQDKLLKVGKETMPNYPEWKSFSFYFDPVRSKSDLRIELTAPYVKDPLGTTVLFDEVKVYKVFSNKLLFINKKENGVFTIPQIAFKKVSPSLYEGEVVKAGQSNIIIFSENYSPFWKLSIYDEGGRKISHNPLHFSANLYANAWYLENTPQNYKIKISYYPQELFLLGSKITIMTIVSSVALAMIFLIRKRKTVS